MKMTVFLLLRAAPGWLQLGRKERGRVADTALGGLKSLGVTLRYFDAEAFSARCSDVAMIETDDPKDYYFAMESLRDSPLIAKGYFEVVDIIPAFEDGFRAYEAAHAV